MTADQKRRVVEAIEDTKKLVQKWSTRKTFDRHQEKERVDTLAQYQGHLAKLEAMLAAAQ